MATVTQAVRGATAAGVAVARVEIEPGRIIITTATGESIHPVVSDTAEEVKMLI
jgi:hypothetical protein